jgi:uncharacterized membrane protein
MILAAYRDSGYKIVLFIHIVTMLVAVAPAVAHPLMFALEKKRTDGDLVMLGKRVIAAERIYVVALIVTGVVGFGLISMSDSVIGWGDTWVSLSILVWIAMNGVLHGAMLPAEKALAAGDETAMKKIDTFGPILVIMVLVLSYLMVVKPGGGGL